MTEAELSFQVSEVFNRLWVIQQWWASISFGVLVFAHVTGKKISIYIVSGVILLYTAYSAYMLEMLFSNSNVYLGYLHDLELLAQSGVNLSTGTNKLFNQPENIRYLAPIVFYGTYSATVGYLIYQYILGRGKVHNNALEEESPTSGAPWRGR